MESSAKDSILWTSGELSKTFTKPGGQIAGFEIFSQETLEKVRAYHGTIPGYARTPLIRLKMLADALGFGEIVVKDESYRFGLNAFKSLGTTYAVGKYIADRLGVDEKHFTFSDITSGGAHAKTGDLVFATTTDGNHGRGLAWTSRMLGHKAVVYMPKGSSPRRVDAIRSECAEVTVQDIYYDDCVAKMREDAAANGWTLIQDTSWEGYTEYPRNIMLGYGTMLSEAFEQMTEIAMDPPTHVFLQAGVGSMAAALAAYLRNTLGTKAPKIVIVEANKADCFYKSCAARDGHAHKVGGALDTIMAGLACGEPSMDALEILNQCTNAFVSCPDYVTSRGMRVLGCPLKGDDQIVSGESGAVTAGLLTYLSSDIHLSALRVMLGMSEQSRILLFSTEGNTDPENYRSIVWDGKYPSF